MNIKQIIYSLFLISFISFAQNSTLNNKEDSVLEYRDYFSRNSYRGNSLKTNKTLEECITLLNDNGVFTDLNPLQDEIIANQLLISDKLIDQDKVGLFITEAYNRLWRIADSFRGKSININNLTPSQVKLFKGYLNYGKLEANRSNDYRFHASCFAIPTAAINSYFTLLPLMDAIEKDNTINTLVFEANTMLKKMGMQSWTHPLRNDSTDDNVVQVERFRNHVWWVGGNALAYRSLLPAAFMMKSIPMVDVVAEVSQKALSSVSQNTYDTAFWTEGFTADGSGWGHGMQSLIWGYPIDGTGNALSILKLLKNSPWEKTLTNENKDAIFNYLRGSSWHYYKGFEPLCLGRMNMKYAVDKNEAKSIVLIDNLIDNFKSSLTDTEFAELKQLKKEISNYKISMNNYPAGMYSGTRYFFNNDDLIKKTDNHYVFVNMASNRVDGNESALFHDRYNFFTDDGLTFFEKNGNEYNKAIGGWDLTAIPGVTNRQADDKLKPITNWRGYCSKYNFAAAATSNSKNAVAGFIFEKMNASAKEGVNDKTGLDDNNPYIYGVKAYKAYFFLDDYMLALGAGITNLNSNLEGTIWTTIDQTDWNNKINWCGSSKKGSFNTNIKSNAITIDNKGKKVVWVQQEKGFSYGIFPDQTTGNLLLKAETRKSRWQELNGLNEKAKDLPKETSVLQLSINHGKDVKNGNYAYFVYLENEFSKRKMNKPNLTILSNTTALQAASTKDEKIIEAVFYDAKEILVFKKGQIKVSVPAVIMLEENKNSWNLSVTDPTMDKNLKTIEVNTTIPMKGSNVSMADGWYNITILLPEGALLGKSITIVLEKE